MFNELTQRRNQSLFAASFSPDANVRMAAELELRKVRCILCSS